MVRELYNETNREKSSLLGLKNKGLNNKSTQLIKDFVEEYGTQKNLSANRKTKYYGSFGLVAKYYNHPLDDPNEKKFIQLINYIKKLDKSETTKNEYVVLLKTFYLKWFQRKFRKTLNEEQKDGLYWLEGYSYKINKNKVQEAEIITEEEMKRMLNSAWTKRDKAFLVMLWELGARCGELLNLQLKDIKPYEHGYEIDIRVSKSMKRKLQLIPGSPYLQTYLESHPDKNNKDAYLFTSLGLSKDGSIKPVTYNAIKKRLQEIVREAGITRRVWIHLFRHTCATRKANLEWGESQMCKWFGWEIGSKQVRTYVKKSGIDIKRLAEVSAGIKKQVVKKDSALQPIPCNNCNTMNEPTNMYCKECNKQLLSTEKDKVTTEEDVKVMVYNVLKDYKLENKE